MLRKTVNVLLILLLFLPQFSFAIDSANPLDSGTADSTPQPALQDESSPSLILETPPSIPETVSFSCRLISLTDEENQRLLDLRRKTGSFDELNSGTEANTRRKTLENDKALIPDSTGELALKQTFPNQQIDPKEVADVLSLGGKGAFAVGLVLDDTLRLGTCLGEYKTNCPVRDKGLTFKNDGTGIISDLKNAAGIVESMPLVGSDGKTETISQKALDNLAMEAELQNPNPVEGKDGDLSALKDANIQVKTAARIPGNALENRIEAKGFEAKMGTTCANGSCVISVYSLFDKYFNSMFSANIVLSNLAPTLIGKAAYLFKTTESRGWQFPFQQTIKNWTKKNYDSFTLPSEIRKGTEERVAFIQRKYGLDATTKLYTSAPTLLTDSAYGNWQKEFFADVFPKIDTYEARRKLVDQATDVYKYQVVMQEMKTLTQNELRDGVITKSEAGTRIAKLMKDYNDKATHFSLQGEFIRNERHGLNEFFIKPTASGQYARITHENVSENLVNEFADNGVFGQNFTADAFGSLKLYKFNATGQPIAAGVQFDTFEAAVRSKQYANQQVAVRLNNGSFMPVDESNLDYIRTNTSGTVDIFKGTIGDAGVVTVDDFSGRLLEWIPTRIDALERNQKKFITTLRERGAASRRYWSLLDKQMLEEKELLKSYLSSIKGAAKWTAYPFMYSWAKQGGVGSLRLEDVSIYRMPQSWSEISFTLGTEKLYNDAFIDFFANAGSDEGDIFTQMLNLLPWKSLVLDPIAEKTPYANIWNSISGKGFRTKSESLAFFIYGPQTKCSSCSASLDSKDLTNFSFRFTTKEELNSFIFENPTSEAAKKQGQTIISYTHHTNLDGKTSSGEGNQINLVDAVFDKKTCSDAAKEALGFDAGPRGSSLILGGAELIGYGLFGMAGMIGSAIQQAYFAPIFNDCVDVEQGYFIHYFMPAQNTKDQKNSSAIAGAEKASGIIDSGQKAVNELVNGIAGVENSELKSIAESAKEQGLSREELLQKQGGQGVLSNAASKLKESTDKIVSQIQDKDILQALFKTQGSSSGQAVSKGLYWFWFEGGQVYSKTKYRTEGVTNYIGPDGNLMSDYAKGQISLNGEVIVNADGSRPELQRLIAKNLVVPADEIPARVTGMRMPGERTLMFETTARGETFIRDNAVLNCIQQAVMEQSGVRMSSNNLAEVFGFTTFIETEDARVTPNSENIIVEGPLRFVAEGANSRIEVFGNRDVNVTDEQGLKVNAGALQSIMFENGSMVYNPEKNELIIWLRHNKMAVPTVKDVTGLKAKLTTDKNPLTNCDEPAIDLELIANSNSGLSEEKVANFNAGMKINGPFKVFETDKAIFTFYANPPDCKPRFRMLDKETGQVYDQEIKAGTLKQTPNGIQFETADGQKHTMDFSAPDGKPILTYNGVPQNLLSAQGKNGSFYFNPDTGEYFAENGQFIPLNSAFKQGISPRVNADGTVSTVPGQNIFAPTIGTGDNGEGLFNLPSIPQEFLLTILFISAICASIVLIRIRK